MKKIKNIFMSALIAALVLTVRAGVASANNEAELEREIGCNGSGTIEDTRLCSFEAYEKAVKGYRAVVNEVKANLRMEAALAAESDQENAGAHLRNFLNAEIAYLRFLRADCNAFVNRDFNTHDTAYMTALNECRTNSLNSRVTALRDLYLPK